MPMLAIRPSTTSFHNTRKWMFCDVTNRHKHKHCNFKTESAQWADSVNTFYQKCHLIRKDSHIYVYIYKKWEQMKETIENHLVPNHRG